MSGCVSHKEYRTAHKTCIVKQQETLCESSSQEQHDGYLLNFVEFDDQGLLWDREQLTNVVNTLRSQEYLDSGVIMIVFVHGWQHNASFDDPNVIEFRKMLRRVHKLEYLAAKQEKRSTRKVAGIFASWRGRSVPGDVISNLTFWDRKNVANTVGHGAVTELLLQLENVQIAHFDADKKKGKHNGQTRLILVGHSFGGQIVYSALSQVLLDRFLDLEGEPPQTFGDLVILVNPAFEAGRYAPLRDASLQRKYPAGQLPLVTIFTSKNDGATGTAFPIGRWFSTMFEQTRDDVEEKANRTAIGHFKPFVSHSLTWEKEASALTVPIAEDKKRSLEDESIELKHIENDLSALPALQKEWSQKSSQNGWALDFGNVKLTHLKTTDPLNPFYNVEVDSAIIDGHSGIWKPEFANFLRQFIVFSVLVTENSSETGNTGLHKE
ncbi:alpha/beta fold hydrolase [Geobacter pelophilus]|uniref:Alpha/beta fold hydrolase n=2 Tax=Geoanaerobacter pelophilus TaxID=60036 RepID=A0AAW4LBS0_9BACT|nr:alpha/beta fold hydrolase [Geoanaerobacter pelophilus]